MPGTVLYLVYVVAQQSSGVCVLMALLLLDSVLESVHFLFFFKWLCAIYFYLVVFMLVGFMIGCWNVSRPLFSFIHKILI